MPVTFNSEIACRNTYLWYHKPKCSVDSWSTLSLRKNPPSLLKVPLETGHVLKPTTFLKFLFGGPNFLWENRTGGEFPLIIGPPARVVVENPMNPSLSIQYPTACYVVSSVCSHYLFSDFFFASVNTQELWSSYFVENSYAQIQRFWSLSITFFWNLPYNTYLNAGKNYDFDF